MKKIYIQKTARLFLALVLLMGESGESRGLSKFFRFKNVLVILILLMGGVANKAYSQFSGISGTGDGINFSSYGNITTDLAGVRPFNSGNTSVTVFIDFWQFGFSNGVNLTSATLFYKVNSATFGTADDATWTAVGSSSIAAVSGSDNDRATFTLSGISAGTEIMFYIRAATSTGGNRTGYAYPGQSGWSTTAPSSQSQTYKIRFNNANGFNTARLDGLTHEWVPSVSQVSSRTTASDSRTLDMMWDDTWVYFLIPNGFTASNGDRVHIAFDRNSGSGGNANGTTTSFNGASFPENFRPDIIFRSRGTGTNTWTHDRGVANGSNGWTYTGDIGNSSGSDMWSVSNSNTNNLEIAIRRSAIGTFTSLHFVVYFGSSSDNVYDAYPNGNSSANGLMPIQIGFANLNTSGSIPVPAIDEFFDGQYNHSGIFNIFGITDYRNLTISNSGGTIGVATGATLNVSGNLTINSGASFFLSGTPGIDLSVRGNFTNNGTFNGNSRAVFFTGGNNQDIAGTLTIPFLFVNKSAGSLNLQNNISVSGNLEVTTGTFNLGAFTANRSTSGGTLTLGSGANLRIGGTNSFPSSYSTHSINAGSTVEYSGTTQSIAALNSSQNYGNLIISGSGTKSLSANIGVAGNLSINGGTFNLGSSTANRTAAGGTFTLASGTTLQIGGTNSFPGNYTTHSIDAGSTVEYSGTTQSIAALNSSQNYGNLIISGSGIKSLSANIGVAGNLSINGGTFNLGSSTADRTAAGGTFTLASGTTLQIGGTNSFPGNYTTHSIDASSTVEYSGTTQSIVALNSSQNYGNLIISGSGTKSLSANIGVVGNLSVNGGTLNLASFTADRTAAGGTFTLAGGTTLQIGGTNSFPGNYTTHSIDASSTVEYTGTAQSIPALNSSQNYGNLIISGSGTKSLSANIGVAGNLSVNGGTFNLGSSTANRIASGGTITLAAGTTLQIGGTNGFPSNYSTKSIAANSTVAYNGDNQTADGTTQDVSYGNLELSGSGTKIFASTPAVAGNFVVGGTATVTAPAQFNFNGATPQSIAGLAYNNIQFSGAGAKAFTSNGSLGASSTMSFVSGSGAIDFDGSSNDVVFTLLSDATGTATIANTNGVTLNGRVTAQRYFGNTNKRAWRLITAPVAGTGSIFSNWQTASGSATGVLIWGPGGNPADNGLQSGPNASMRGWDNANGAFVNVSNTLTTNLSDASDPKGYFLFVSGPASTTDINAPFAPATVAARGTLLQGNYTFSISTPVTNRFYLVPNPYASPVDQGSSGISMVNTTDKLWMWDPSLSGNFGVGGYVSFDRLINQFNVQTAGYLNGPSYSRLQSGQAFFVQAASNPAGALSVGFTESNKGGGSGNGAFRIRSTSSEKMRVILQRNFSDSYATTDGVVAVFYNNANAGVDDMDGVKLNNSNDNLMFRRGTSSLTFEHRPQVQQFDTLFLNLSATSQTGYRLLLEGSDFTTSAQLGAWLQDTYLNTETMLNLSGTTSYDFAVDANAASTGQRFRIVFRNNVVTPVRDIDGLRAFSIYPNPVQQGGQLSLEFRNRAAGKYTVTVFNLLGMQVQQGVVTHGGGTAVQTLRLNSGLAAGNYVVEVTDDKGNRMQQKISIQ